MDSADTLKSPASSKARQTLAKQFSQHLEYQVICEKIHYYYYLVEGQAQIIQVLNLMEVERDPISYENLVFELSHLWQE